MYLSFYEFTKKPFQDATHPDFFWAGKTYREALSLFRDGILITPGFLVLTGDIGTGKTILSNELIRSLGDEAVVAKIPDPGLEVIDFLNCVSDAFEMNSNFVSKDDFYVHFDHFLNNAAKTGRKLLLIIDECQRLRSDLFGEIRKLAHIDKQATKALSILLIGQNELNDFFQNHDGGALHQRIPITYTIPPLNLQETTEFIHHRLKTVGAKEDIFTPDAIRQIHQFSSGIPRKINIICDNALLSGFIKGTKTLTGEIVRECAKYFTPPDYPKKPDNEPRESVVSSNSKTINEVVPEGTKKIDTLYVWTVFGTITLITIGVFILTYFIYPKEYESFFYRAKNNGIRAFNLLGGTRTPKLDISSESHPETSPASPPDQQDPKNEDVGKKFLLSPPAAALLQPTGKPDLLETNKNNSPEQVIPSSENRAAEPEDNRITDGVDTGVSEKTETDAADNKDENNDFQIYSRLKEQMIQKIRNDQSREPSE